MWRILLYLFFLWPSVGHANACLKFGIEYTQIVRLVGAHLQQALKNSDLCIEFHFLPAPHIISGLRKGLIDGDIVRVSSYDKKVGDMIVKVPEPLVNADGLLVTFDSEVQTVADLAGKRLGIRQDFIWHQEATAGIDLHKVSANDEKTLVNMLLAKRVDAILLNSVSIKGYEALLKGAHVRVIANRSVFVWLHKGKSTYSQAINDLLVDYKKNNGSFVSPIPLMK